MTDRQRGAMKVEKEGGREGGRERVEGGDVSKLKRGRERGGGV
jgi:hypothetical protein